MAELSAEPPKEVAPMEIESGPAESAAPSEVVYSEVPKDEAKDVDVSQMGSQGIFGFWTSVVQADKPNTKVMTAADYPSAGALGCMSAGIDNFFRVSERGSTFYYEFCGGMTTFFSMCYILALNGIIIAGPYNTGMNKAGVFFATALASGLFTFCMGLFVNVPVALAPGMGLNGFFAVAAQTCYANPTGDINGVACPGWGTYILPWSDAMGAVFLSGWFYLFFTFTGLRAMLFQAVPKSLRAAITVGIGMFITMIGLKIGKITRITLSGWAIPIVNFQGGCSGGYCPNNVDLDFSFYGNGIVDFPLHPEARIAVLGLVFASGLTMLRVNGAIIISICLASFIGINYVKCPGGSLTVGSGCVTDLTAGGWNTPGGTDANQHNNFIVDVRDIPSGKLTFKYANTPFFWDCVWTFLFVELFDSFGTLSGIMTRAGFMKGDPELAMTRVNRAMCVDGWGLWLGAIIGSNSITCYIESNTGVEAGARTGLASIVTGSAFLLSLLFIAPFVEIIPDAATTCALVMVGVHSLQQIQEVNFNDIVDQMTAFLTLAIMGFTYSIANGISVGFIFFSWMRTLRFVQAYLAKNVKTAYSESWEPGYKGPGLDLAGEPLAMDLPHPLMIIMACFMAIRFAYLAVV